MKPFVKINDHIEIVHHGKETIIADHTKFRYIRMKDSEYLRFIEESLKKGQTYPDLFAAADEQQLNIELVKEFIRRLVELGILIETEWPDNKDQGPDNQEIKEIYNGRFIHEIEAFSSYESLGINRFQAFDKIRNGSVAIIGAGGVGSNIAIMLSAAGIGRIVLVDGDQVEESNLVRQVFYKKEDCGKARKVAALKQYIEAFSDYTKVETIEAYIKSVEDAETYLHNVDVVIQTADTPRGVINRIISDYSARSGCASIYCANGTVGPFYIPGRSGSFRDLEDRLNRETKGLYDLFVEIKNKEASRAAPSEVGGPWLAAYYLYNEIIDYLVGVRKLNTENAIIKLDNGGFDVEICDFEQIG